MDIFTLTQFITTIGMSQIDLINTEVLATGGLNKKLTLIVVNNTILGQVIITLCAEIAWRKITLIVTSQLKGLQSPYQNITNKLITSFKPFLGQPQLGKNETIILWCSTPTYQSIPTLHLNDTVTLKLIVLKSEMKDYYFNETEVWYTGEVLNKKVVPIDLNEEVKGEITIQLR